MSVVNSSVKQRESNLIPGKEVYYFHIYKQQQNLIRLQEEADNATVIYSRNIMIIYDVAHNPRKKMDALLLFLYYSFPFPSKENIEAS